ncbi:hypothetical protein HK107_14530 [Parvularcula sp. ZS-1/3]|uniref:Uncharacterized protein n=1 Tax=Parvularcula mediterranea TaxID=2732508 RepID=A0A7Y3W6B3_9PROT|nr:hypothetical protein [Parvularcula mediterranea]NNU17544.1 hypothetical protein [Parvularcula mediterranea]
MTHDTTDRSSRPAPPRTPGSKLPLFSLMALPAIVAEGLAGLLQGLLFRPMRANHEEGNAEDAETIAPSPAFGGCDLLERYDYVPGRPFAYPLADEGVLPRDHG